MEKIKNLHFFIRLNTKDSATNTSFKERFFIFDRAERRAPEMPDTTDMPKPDSVAESDKKIDKKIDKIEETAKAERREESEKIAQGLTLDTLDQSLFDSILDDADEDVNLALLAVQQNVDNLVKFASGSEENMEKILEAIDDDYIKIENLSDTSFYGIVKLYAGKDDLDDFADKLYEKAIEKNNDNCQIKLALILGDGGFSAEKATELAEDLYEAIEDEDVSIKKLNINLVSVLASYFTEINRDPEKATFILKECTKDGTIASNLLDARHYNEKLVREFYNQLVLEPETIKSLNYKAVTILLKFYKPEEILPLLTPDQKNSLILSIDRSDQTKSPLFQAIYESLDPTAKKAIDALTNEKKPRRESETTENVEAAQATKSETPKAEPDKKLDYILKKGLTSRANYTRSKIGEGAKKLITVEKLKEYATKLGVEGEIDLKNNEKLVSFAYSLQKAAREDSEVQKRYAKKMNLLEDGQLGPVTLAAIKLALENKAKKPEKRSSESEAVSDSKTNKDKGTITNAGDEIPETTNEIPETENPEYVEQLAKENEKTFQERSKYLDEDFHLTDKDLLKAINNDELWNDLWEQRGLYEKAYIEGLETIKSSLRQFGVTEEKMRVEVRNLLQEWTNEKVTFEEIFNRYIKEKIYKDGNFNDFVKELNQITEEVAKNPDPRTNEGKIFRLNYLKNEIFFPVAELLNAFKNASVKISVEQKFIDQYETLFSQLPPATESSIGSYYSYESLSKGNDEPAEFSKAPDNIKLVSISSNFKNKFDKVTESLGLEKADFTDTAMVKIIFQLYTIDSLAAEKCIQKDPGSSNKFILTDLPKSFNAENPQIKELFTEVKSGSDIKDKKDLIKKISETIDKNKAVITKLLKVFSKDEGPLTYNLIPVDLLGITYLIRALDGQDRRELTLTMQDIGERKDTLMTDDYLNRYTSDKSAFTEILSRVTRFKDGVATYDGTLLNQELGKRLKAGLSYLAADKKNFTALRNNTFAQFGSPDDPDTLIKAQAYFFEQISNKNAILSQSAKEVIRLGHVIDGVLEQDQKINLSKNPKILKIQEAMLKTGKFNTDDIKKVEEIFAGGLIVPVNGDHGIDAFQGYDFGNEWKLGLGASITEGGVTAGAAAIKGIPLTKNGRTILTLSVQGGFLTIGGAVNLSFPISETVDANIGGTAGITYVGFYALGAIGARKNLNAEALAAFKNELDNEGFKQVEELIAKKASPSQIREALLKIPHYSTQFNRLKSEFKVSDQGLIEIYTKIKEATDARTTNQSKLVPLEIIGGGAFGGVVNVVPVVGAWLEFAIADKVMIIRSPVAGSEHMKEMSDAEIQAQLAKQGKKGVEILKYKAGESGHFVYDSVTGKVAILEGTNTVDLSTFDTLKNYHSELEKVANMGLTKEMDGTLRLHVNNPREAQANIKVDVDPLLKSQGIFFSVEGNRIILKGISEEEFGKLIVTREDFHYPFNEPGAITKYSVVTIKNDPSRSRTQIEKESSNIIYQRAGFRPEIREGLGKGKTTPVILTYDQFKALEMKPEETIDNKNLENFESWKTKKDQTLNVIKRATFEQEPRKGIVPEFAKEFYKNHRKLYRELSTQGQKTFDPEKLNALIKTEADKKGFKDLTPRELTDIHLWLLHASFMNANDKQKIFLDNLAVCKKRVLEPFFEKMRNHLGLVYSGKEMAEYVANDLKKTNIKSVDFEKLKEGALFLSSAGTMDIWGLRGTTYYGKDLDIAHGILGFKEYKPNDLSLGENGKRGPEAIEGEIGKVLLEVLSPIERDPSKVKEFMESPLALKLAGMDALYLLLGSDNANKVIESFKTKSVSPENTEAFEQFREIVMTIRDVEFGRGETTIKLKNGYDIKVNTKVGVGAYKKCTNPTLAGNEDLEIYAPVAKQGQVAYNRSKVLLNSKAVKKAISLILGVRAEIPEAPEVTPEEITPEPNPEGGVSAHPKGVTPDGTPKPPDAAAPGTKGPTIE